MNESQIVLVHSVRRLEPSRNGAPRWELFCFPPQGGVFRLRTKPGVAASYACNLDGMVGEVLRIMWRETTAAQGIAHHWEVPGSADDEANRLRLHWARKARAVSAMQARRTDMELDDWVVAHLTPEELVQVANAPFGWPEALAEDHLLRDEQVLGFVRQQFHAEVVLRIAAKFLLPSVFEQECKRLRAKTGSRTGEVAALVLNAIAGPEAEDVASLLARMEQKALSGGVPQVIPGSGVQRL